MHRNYSNVSKDNIVRHNFYNNEKIMITTGGYRHKNKEDEKENIKEGNRQQGLNYDLENDEN